MSISELKFSNNIIDFNKALKLIDWKKKFPHSVFFRDHENLPFKAPYDIDLIVAEDQIINLRNCLQELAKNFSLTLISKNFDNSMIIILFDLSSKKDRRNWVFFEIRKKYLINKKVEVLSDKIDIYYEKNKLPIPKKEWQVFFYFHQFLRKRKKKHFDILKKLSFTKKNNIIIRKLLNLSEEEIVEALRADNKIIKNYKSTNFFNEIKKKIIKKIYFFRVKSDSLFTINGADGVGKSSILNQISKIVEYYPFEVELIHHNKGGVKKSRPMKQDNKSYFRKTLSLIYINLPKIFKEIWLYFTHYYRYTINMNSFVMNNSFSSKIIILDRYIYDLWAKDKVKRELSSFTISFVYNIFCRIIKFPNKAYFIYDKPDSIYKRKKELTKVQINFFQICLTKIFKRIKVSFEKVLVKKHKPNDLAKKILEDIIQKNSDLIISIVKQNTRF